MIPYTLLILYIFRGLQFCVMQEYFVYMLIEKHNPKGMILPQNSSFY